MTEQEKFERLVSPEKFMKPSFTIGNLLGNKDFTEFLVTQIKILEESQYWSHERMANLQQRRLTKVFSVLDKSDFWSSYLKKYNVNISTDSSLEELNKLPILDRHKLAQLGGNIFLKNALFYRYTSGTSGMRLRIAEDELDRINFIYYRFRPSALDSNVIRGALSRKFAVFLGMTGGRFGWEDFTHHIFQVSSSDLENVTLRRDIYSKLEQVKPAMLLSKPSVFTTFMQHFKEDNVDLPIFILRIGGEPLDIDSSLEIRKNFEVPVVNIFGTSEMGPVGFECTEHAGRFHINSERVLVEIVGDDGVPVKEGEEGEILLSTLDIKTLPVLRYAIGDRGKAVPGLCSCKSRLLTVELRYREGNEHFVLPSGKRVKAGALKGKLMSVGITSRVRQLQICQEAKDSLTLLLVTPHKLKEDREMQIRLAFTELFDGEKVKIDIEYADSIPLAPDGKQQLFISNISDTQ
jgi:phenylacetate-coenzyme A ligase PaaK-like adenylate-forming protein